MSASCNNYKYRGILKISLQIRQVLYPHTMFDIIVPFWYNVYMKIAYELVGNGKVYKAIALGTDCGMGQPYRAWGDTKAKARKTLLAVIKDRRVNPHSDTSYKIIAGSF